MRGRRSTFLVLVTTAATVAFGAAMSVTERDTSFAIIAHRGASWDAPEHTFAAWDLAIAEGADWIEQDLQMTRDGVLIVVHDDTLERTARGGADDCTGRVRDHTLAELRRCEFGGWFNAMYPERADARFATERIPTLDSILARYAGRARFYIETKHPADAPGLEEALVGLLRRHRLAGAGADTGRVIIQSFSEASLALVHALDPAIPLVRLLEDPIPQDSLGPILERIARSVQGIGPSRRILTPRMVEVAHQQGLFVHVYTVNDLPVLDWMRGVGVDGVFTDRPGLLRTHLGR